MRVLEDGLAGKVERRDGQLLIARDDSVVGQLCMGHVDRANLDAGRGLARVRVQREHKDRVGRGFGRWKTQ